MRSTFYTDEATYVKSIMLDRDAKDARDLTLEWIAWSFSAMTAGKWPSADPFGNPFSETYMPRWHALSGSWLADEWRGVLDGVQADQDWIFKTFRTHRCSGSISII